LLPQQQLLQGCQGRAAKKFSQSLGAACTFGRFTTTRLSAGNACSPSHSTVTPLLLLLLSVPLQLADTVAALAVLPASCAVDSVPVVLPVCCTPCPESRTRGWGANMKGEAGVRMCIRCNCSMLKGTAAEPLLLLPLPLLLTSEAACVSGRQLQLLGVQKQRQISLQQLHPWPMQATPTGGPSPCCW
jgi:hypothetical protein